MAFFTQNKFNYTTGVPDGDGIYPSESSTWGDDGAGVLGNGTIAFPTAAGGAGEVLTDVAGNGTLTFASVPSTPPSGILGSVQLSDGAGGFTSDQPSFNYNSTTKRLGIGKVATTSLDVFHDDIDVNALLENVSASFDEIAVGLKLKHRSTNSMDPGLGIAQEYYIEDDTSGELLAGSITFQRQSADALRKFVVKGGTNGTQELFSIDSNREFTIEGGLRSGFGFGFTPPANSLAWNINNAGASVIIGNGGSGLGLRVLANLGNILSLEDTNQVAQVLVSNTGLVTFNDAANATADFEVKAQTTGTVVYADVSTGNTIFGQGVTGSRTVEMHGGNGASAELIIHGNSGGLGSNQDTSIRFKSGSLTRWRMGVDEGTTDDPFVIDPSGSLSGTAFSISRASGNPAKFGGNLTVNGGRIDCLNTASSPASVTIDSLNRASSLSIISRSSGGGSGRDAYMRFRIGTGDHFYIGMDDNDSGILKISGNGYFGSEDFMTFDQSTFKTVLNASASATGDVEILQSGGGQLALFDAGTGEIFLNLPTSAGTTGSLYNDSGTVKVA